MRYLLDTNACVDYLTGRYPSVAARLRALGPSDACLSSVVVAELRYGADKSAHVRRNHRMLDTLMDKIPCQAFDDAAAAAYGKIALGPRTARPADRLQRHADRGARAVARPSCS